MKRKVAFLAVGVLVALLFGITKAQAQYHYNFGIGLKFGSPWSSITAKYFANDASAFEGLVHIGNFGLGTTCLYEHHFMISGVPGLRWYLGGGAHFAVQYADGYNPFAAQPINPLYAGIDGVGGLEYIFEKAPFTVGADISPLINFVGGVSAWWNAGFYGRYTF